MFDADVLVVGGGPVGEMLLVQLGKRGISAIGLEKDEVVWPKPRAVHFDGETLRTFQALGLGDVVASMCESMGTYRMENEAGEVLMDFATGRIGSQGWLDSYMFHQPEIDALLRNQIEQLPSVQLINGATVVSIEQDADSVTATVRDLEGIERTYRSRYLVGADGASSFVRRAMGSKFEDLGGNDPWLIVDGDLGGDAPIEGSMVLLAHHSRPKIWGRMPGNRARMELKILDSDDQATITDPDKLSALTKGVLTPENFAVVRSAVYVFRACVATSWRDRRVFIAGDAAHLAPPLFGQGLCSGIRDTVNLAWKLAYVLGGSDPSLLDSYETERKAHARAWVEQARVLAETIATTIPEVAAGRDAYIRANPGAGAPQTPLLGDGLHGATAGFVGALAVQPIIDGIRFDDVVGARFVVAARRELIVSLPEGTASALTAAESRITLVSEGDLGFAELTGSVDAGAVVVRPDRYILGVASTPQELAALCNRLLGITSPAVSVAT